MYIPLQHGHTQCDSQTYSESGIPQRKFMTHKQSLNMRLSPKGRHKWLRKVGIALCYVIIFR